MGHDTLARFGVTDEQLDAWEEDASRGVFPGEPRGEIVIGRPRLTDEPLRAVTVTLPQSMVEAIDRQTKNRSDFIRKAVAACL
uniref:CopG family transcriptional regulator n=1 Tax=Muribaculaceae bacterium Z82 TaxID=2304548 RepID=A0A7C9NUH2_9BACT